MDCIGNNPEISIIMPVYNSEQYLKNTLNSILAQDFDDFELLLIDDGSQDSSGDICDQFALQDKRIRAFHKINGGICSARNYGLAKATGEYVGFCDNDDEVLPGWLSDNIELAKEYRADIVRFSRRWIIEKGAEILSDTKTQFQAAVIDCESLDSAVEQILDAGWGVWSGFYRREFLIENNLLFDEEMLFGHEDRDFTLRSLLSRPSVVLNPNTYYIWRMRFGHSTSWKVDGNNIESYMKAMGTLEALCVQSGLSKRNPLYFPRALADSIYYIAEYVCRPGAALSLGEKAAFLKKYSALPAFQQEIEPEILLQMRRQFPKSYVIFRLFLNKHYRLICQWVTWRLAKQ